MVADGLKGGPQAVEYSEEALAWFFGQFGTVLTFKRGLNANGDPTGQAFIEFATGAAAQRAIGASPHQMGDWSINLWLQRAGMAK